MRSDGGTAGGGDRPPESIGGALVRMLREAQTEVCFGIPGIHTMELFRYLKGSGIRHVLNRSEQGAVFAADGYARTTGRPGVALLISGPGVTNAATPVAQAYHDSIPLLIVSGVISRAELDKHWGAVHELPDQHGLMASLTAFSEHVEDPAALPGVLERAFELFDTGRPRPVHIQIPADVLLEPAPPMAFRRTQGVRPRPDRAEVGAAAHALASARRPMLLIGGGAVDAGTEIVKLAERLGSPIVATMNAKGVVPDRHPLNVGTTLFSAATTDALGDSDVLLAVGTEFSPIDFYFSDGPPRPTGQLIRLDIDPGQLQAQLPAPLSLHSDAALGLESLDNAISRLDFRPSRQGPELAAQIRTEVEVWPRARPLVGLVEAIGAAMPEDAMVACDSTQLAYLGQSVWPGLGPRSWMIPAGFGTLGSALSMATGASVGRPGAPAICVVGDGGLLFSIGEMAATASLGLPVVMLLWNNDGYQEMRDEMDELLIDHVGTEASARDFQMIATGFGWTAERPDSIEAVASSLTTATRRGGPTLIELTPDVLD